MNQYWGNCRHETVDTTQLENTNYQLGWALGSGQVGQAGKIWREGLDNRMSTDYQLMVNHGLIASAKMSKVNIWGWLLPAK